MYAVTEKKLLTKKGFDSLRASDKFRILFSSIGLPLGIPNNLTDFAQLAQSKQGKNQWGSSPEALTEIRNALVHPEKENIIEDSQALFQAWNLLLWYLELSLLFLCGHKGTYANRLVLGHSVRTVEPVPWTKGEP